MQKYRLAQMTIRAQVCPRPYLCAILTSFHTRNLKILNKITKFKNKHIRKLISIEAKTYVKLSNVVKSLAGLQQNQEKWRKKGV